MKDIKYIEVVGNDAANRQKLAKRLVEDQVKGAKVIDVSFFARGATGSPVYAVEYEVED